MYNTNFSVPLQHMSKTLLLSTLYNLELYFGSLEVRYKEVLLYYNL
jgi:hypothetical protein